jgi:hypothetical protein
MKPVKEESRGVLGETESKVSGRVVRRGEG